MKNYVPFVLAVILLSACIGVSACAPASSSSQAASESSQATDASSAASAESSAASDDSSQTNAESSAASADSSAAATSAAAVDQQTASSSAAEGKVRIGVAWRPNQQSLSYVSTCRALEAAGIDYVVLNQVLSPDFTYDANNKLTTGKTEAGTLTAEAGKLVRCNTWQDSDVANMLEGINAVVFPGGEDISPSLYYAPQELANLEGEDYSAERDVSDFLLMSYCLEHDIPLMAICRGMQVLSVVSGAEMEQDIPTWFAEQGLEYQNEHRQLPDEQGNRDFTATDIQIDTDSILYSIVQKDSLDNCPCWHHQVVRSVEGTRLDVAAHTVTEGVEMIETVERTDKTYAIGVQFHPEISITKVLDGEANASDYLDYDTALLLFERLKQEAYRQLEEDPDNLGLRPAA